MSANVAAPSDITALDLEDEIDTEETSFKCNAHPAA